MATGDTDTSASHDHDRSGTLAELESRLRQQEAVAHLGQQALAKRDLGALFDLAAAQVASVLGVEFCTVLELQSDGQSMVRRAWTGWGSEDAQEQVAGGLHSQAGYTLMRAEPVIVEDMTVETRFEVPGIIVSYGIISGVSVPVSSQTDSYGVLGALTRHRRSFTHHDVHFLEAVSHVLAAAIQRSRIENELSSSRNQLHVILEGVADGIAVQDRSGKLVYANLAAARMIGFSSVAELHAADWTSVVQSFEMYDENGTPLTASDRPGPRVLRGEPPVEMRMRHRSRDGGDERWARIRSSPVVDEQGLPQLAVTVFQDISAHVAADNERQALLEREHQARFRAEASQRRLRFVAEASEILSQSLEFETTLATVARLAVPALGDWCTVDVLEEDGAVRRIALTNPDPEKEQFARDLEKRFPTETMSPNSPLQTGKSMLVTDIPDEMLVNAAQDEEHLAILRALGLKSAIGVPLRARGRILGVLTLISSESGLRYDQEDLALIEDLGRRAAVAVDNARLYRQSQDTLKLREEFLSIASHELKTPLTALQLQVQVLNRFVFGDDAQTLPRERVRHVLGGIERQLKRLSRLVTDLLDVSRISAGRLELEWQDVDLAELVADVVERFAGEALATGSVITVRREPVTISGDPFRLDQVITNLLSNAIRYGEGRPVNVTVDRVSDVGRVRVCDHGIGIAEDQKSLIFNRFERVAVSHNYGGLGLGLYIAQQIVDAHAGKVHVDSTLGAGSTFSVELSMRRPKGE